jgi:mycobactin lysine-N-oxygenase
VIGGGETAAGVITGLLKIIDKSSQIEIITRHPILFTRNENWMEVMYFSKVMDWSGLSNHQKTEVIRHADRGTFSVAAKDLLDSAYNVSTRLANVEGIEGKNGKLSINFSGDQKKQIGDYDYVVEATGFNPFSFSKLFPDKSLFNNVQLITEAIEQDLSLAQVSPRLHLPGLSAMAQGPGFPNLSCLGLLADRILTPYISK